MIAFKLGPGSSWARPFVLTGRGLYAAGVVLAAAPGGGITVCEFCGQDGERCAVCGYDSASAGSLAGRLAAVNRAIDSTRLSLAGLERERASLRDQLGLRPDNGSDQPKLFEGDAQPGLFGAGVAFEV